MIGKKKQETPADGFTCIYRQTTNKWRVYEHGKFRQPFDTKEDAETFIGQERAKKTRSKKGTSHA